MGRRGMLLVLGVAAAAVSAALSASPAAYADDDQLLNIPGLFGPIGNPTNVQNFDLPPLFGYGQEDNLFNVEDSNNTVIGSFTDTSSGFSTPFFGAGNLPPLFFGTSQDVISNSTYAGLADGAEEIDSRLVTFVGIPTINFQTLILLGNDYVNNPGIATSDTLTLFNLPIQLWDIPADTAGGAAVDSSWLTDLAGLL